MSGTLIIIERCLLPSRNALWLLLALVCGCGEPQRVPAPDSQRRYEEKAGAAFFEDHFIPTIVLTITGTNLTALQADSRAYVRATFREAEREWFDVAVHLKGSKGGSFRPLEDKPALTVNFDKFRKGQKYHGLDKFYLNNSVEDARYMTEHLCGELFREAGVPAPLVTHAHLYLNEVDRGLYVLKEGWDKGFLRRAFTNADGTLYDSGLVFEIDEGLNVNVGEDTEQAVLKTLAAAAREPDLDKRWESLQRLLDLDRFLSFMAMEILTSHTDGYCLNKNNYRIYHDTTSGKLTFLPHGMDIMFGTPELSITPPMTGLVAQAIMEIPQGRALYLQRLEHLFRSIMDRPRLEQKVDALQQRIRPVLAQIDPKLAKDHDHAVAGLRFAISQRLRSVDRELQVLTNAPPATRSFNLTEAAAWRPDAGYGTHLLDQISVGDQPTLHIRAGTDAPCTASWRYRLELAPGAYTFRAKTKASGIVPLAAGKDAGAGIRLSGLPSAEGSRLDGSADWTDLSYEFMVPPGSEAEVELICELRASAGEAWFDLKTLRVDAQASAVK